MKDEKKQRQKELSELANNAGVSREREVKNLERELDSMNAELNRIEAQIRDKRSQPSQVSYPKETDVVYDEAHKLLLKANDLRYEQLSTEIGELRIQLLGMKLSNYQNKVMTKSLGKAHYQEIEGLTKEKLSDMISYTADEMLTQVDTDIPLITQQRENAENERLMLKQLIANIERNRIKWR